MEIFFLHPFKYLFGSFLAFFFSFGEYQDIIHVDDQPSFGYHVSESQVHEGLKGWRGIALPKEHDQEFVEAIGSDEFGLPLISFLDMDVVVPQSYIHLGEVFGSF